MKVGFGLAYHAAVVTRTRSLIGRRLARSVTIENRASRQGMVRAMALSDHWRSRLHAEMGASLLEGDLDAPTLHELGHDPHRLAAQVGAEQGLGCEAVLGIAHQHPSDRHDW